MTFDRLYPSKKLLQVEQHLRKVWAGEIPCTYSSLTSQSYYRGLRPREDMYRAAADFGDSVLFVPYLSPQGHDRFPRFSDYLFYLHSIQKSGTRLWLLLDPNDLDYPRQLEAARAITGEPEGT